MTWILATGIVGAVVWAYATSYRGVFVFDDRPAIVENTTIRSLTLPDVLIPPPTTTVSGRPVANASLALNYALAPPPDETGLGSAPWIYHATNLSIHVLAALALFGVVRRTLESPAVAYAPQRGTLVAGAIAVLWGLHPLTTSAVTYIVQRVESLMACMYLLTLYCSIRAGGGHRRSGWWAAGAVLACGLGMGSKESMVSAPIAVWLWDIVFGGASWNPFANRSRRRLYIGLAGTWLIVGGLLANESQARLVLGEIATFGSVEGWTPLSYLWTQAGVILHYLRLILPAAELAFDYSDWSRVGSLAEAWLSVGAVAGLLVASVTTVAYRRAAGFPAAIFFLILAPTSSLLPIPTEPAAEHRMYLPLAAIISLAFVAWDQSVARRLGRIGGIATSLLVLWLAAAEGAATRARNRVYWSAESLWADTVSKRPANVRARFNYGLTLLASGRDAEAEAQMRAALTLPADPAMRAQIHLQLGSALCAQRKLAEGIPHIEQALTLAPDVAEAHAIHGQALIDAGDVPAGVRAFRNSLDRDPDNPRVLARFAWFSATGEGVAPADRAAAIEAGERAIRLTAGRDAASLQALAAAYARASRFDEAIAHARRGLEVAREHDPAAAAALTAHLLAYERAAAQRRAK